MLSVWFTSEYRVAIRFLVAKKSCPDSRIRFPLKESKKTTGELIFSQPVSSDVVAASFFTGSFSYLGALFYYSCRKQSQLPAKGVRQIVSV